MDTTLFEYQKYSEKEALEVVNKLRDQSNILAILWRNSFITKNKFYNEALGIKY